MAKLINLKAFSDDRGNLTVIEKVLPFDIKRVYYIYGMKEGIERGGHRHFKTIQALISVSGSCIISTDDGKTKSDFILDSPDKCLIVNPEDWHTMHSFKKNSVLLVLASEYFDPDDYIDKGY
jgi:hypothetical protein